MKVYLDDQRIAPEGWIAARWPEDVIALLETGTVEELSLDHDLGDADERRTGYDVLVWIEEAVATRGFRPPTIAIHSANAGARQRMLLAVESIARFARAGETGRPMTDDDDEEEPAASSAAAPRHPGSTAAVVVSLI